MNRILRIQRFLQKCNHETARCLSLQVQPAIALVDDIIKVNVSAAKQHQPVTLLAELEERGQHFWSFGHYVTDGAGCLDLDTGVCQGGTYKGIEPMGLLWSMVPKHKPGIRLGKRDITTPYHIQLHLLDGHKSMDELKNISANDKHMNCILDSVNLERWYIRKDVQRIPVNDGCIRGMLFLPSGPGPFPGVIDLFGTFGGLTEFRAALLASRGIASLALAFFQYEDLPKTLADVQLDYFETAANWLSSHNSVIDGGVGVLGVSKGGNLALLMAEHFKQIKAVCAINACHFLSETPITYRGQTLPGFMPDMEHIEFSDEGIKLSKTYELAEVPEECIIKVEKSDAKYLLLFGEDDCVYGPTSGSKIAQRLRNHGKDNFHLEIYPKTGHLLEPPYTPFCRSSYHKFFHSPCVWGGSVHEHSVAQEDSWQRILNFFHTTLT